jgi:hypothetical protein
VILPVLYGDRLVGKPDATADRRAGVLRVHAIHQDVPFTSTMTTAIGREIKDPADWLTLDLTLPWAWTPPSWSRKPGKDVTACAIRFTHHRPFREIHLSNMIAKNMPYGETTRRETCSTATRHAR